jgi:hypothetical protein
MKLIKKAKNYDELMKTIYDLNMKGKIFEWSIIDSKDKKHIELWGRRPLICIDCGELEDNCECSL